MLNHRSEKNGGPLPSTKKPWTGVLETKEFASGACSILQNFAANFVHSKSPMGYGVPYWPAITDNENVKIMSIGSETFVMDDIFRERYQFLNQLMSEN